MTRQMWFLRKKKCDNVDSFNDFALAELNKNNILQVVSVNKLDDHRSEIVVYYNELCNIFETTNNGTTNINSI